MKYHILNASGQLDNHLTAIDDAFDQAKKIVEERLDLDAVDTVFRCQPDLTIPELGIGGYTETSGQVVYISIDPSKHIDAKGYLATLVHEFHHAARFQKIGFSNNLLNTLAQEGLACLFEEEVTGKLPIYAAQKLEPADVTKAHQALKNTQPYDHAKWFFGTKDIQRWFGYTYGYTLCKQYAANSKTDSSHLVSTKASTLITI